MGLNYNGELPKSDQIVSLMLGTMSSGGLSGRGLNHFATFPGFFINKRAESVTHTVLKESKLRSKGKKHDIHDISMYHKHVCRYFQYLTTFDCFLIVLFKI